MTTMGESVGYWMCAVPGCLERWRHRGGADIRLFVVGTKEMVQAGDYYFAYIGDCGTENENTINLLKGLEFA